MQQNDTKIIISFICVYNNDRFLKLMVNSIKTTNLSYCYEIIAINNIENKYKSMVEALNFGKNKARGDVLIFLHQDIIFNPNTDLNFLIDKCINNIALYGVFGVNNDGANKKSISCITDLWSEYNGLEKGEIEEVFTIDECMFACNKKLLNKVEFDGQVCRHWDFYAVDLALQCQLKKIPVYSIGIQLTHYSKGNIATKNFKNIEKELLRKYRKDFDLITYPCGWNYTKPYQIFKKMIKTRWGKFKNRLLKIVSKIIHLKTTFYKFISCQRKRIDLLKFCFYKNNNKKKLVIVTHSSSKTGAPLLALNIIQKMRQQNYDIVCLSLDIDGKGGLTNSFKQESTFFFSKPSITVLKLLKKKGFEKYIVNSMASASILKKILSQNAVITYLIHELPDVIMRLDLVKYVNDIDNYSTTIVFPSSFTKKKYEDAFGENKTKTLIRPQGLYQCCSLSFDKNSVKKEISKLLKISPDKKILLCVGTGDKRKGVDLFFKLASRMEKYPEYVFVWVGPIYYKIDSKYHNLKNIFHIDYIDSDVLLYKFYRSATFYLMMSRSEPFGTIILESFNAETPVIAFDEAGGYLDILKNNKTGFLVKYLDIDAYEKTIIEKQSYSNLSKVIQNAKCLLKDFSFEKYIDFLIGTLSN